MDKFHSQELEFYGQEEEWSDDIIPSDREAEWYDCPHEEYMESTSFIGIVEIILIGVIVWAVALVITYYSYKKWGP